MISLQTRYELDGVSRLHTALEKLINAGQGKEALAEAERYLEERGHLRPREVWIAVRAAQAACIERDWGKAVAWSDRGLTLRRDDPEAAAWLSYFAGTALAHRDPRRAEDELTHFVKAAARLPRVKRFRGDGFYNLAYVYRTLRQTEREVKAFTQAAGCFQEAGREQQALVCAYEIAWGCLLAGRDREAQPYLEQVLQRAVGAGDRELEIDILLAEALFYRLRGDRQRSGQILLALKGMHDLPPRQIADLFWLLGCNALDAGLLEEAARCGQEAYDAAFRVWWPPQLERIALLNSTVVASAGSVGR